MRRLRGALVCRRWPRYCGVQYSLLSSSAGRLLLAVSVANCSSYSIDSCSIACIRERARARFLVNIRAISPSSALFYPLYQHL